jgi:hypothetical protein
MEVKRISLDFGKKENSHENAADEVIAAKNLAI